MLIRFLSVGKIKYFFESDHDLVTLVDFIAAYCVIGVKYLQCMSGLLNFLQEIVLCQASSLPGGGGGHCGEPFAQKILTSCPSIYETVERKRGSYDALTMAYI